MPVPKYVPKSKRKEWQRKHRRIVRTLKENNIKSPYAVASARLKKKYKK